MLAPISLGEFHPRDLGDGIPLVRRLERTGGLAILYRRLRSELWIDAL
jgi:hypothetical protein